MPRACNASKNYELCEPLPRTTEDAINTLLQYITSHLDKRTPTYVRSLYIDYSSAFNTMQPHLLINKLKEYCVHPSLQLWILNFLTNRIQYIKTSKGISSQTKINTGRRSNSMNIAAAHPHLFNTPKTESVQDVDHVKIMKLLDEKNHVIAQSVFKNGQLHQRSFADHI